MQFRRFCVLLLSASAILLSACRHSESDLIESAADTQTAAVITTETEPPAETEPVPTAPVQNTQLHTETVTLPQTSEISVTRYTIPAVTDTPYQGGEGDEAHAETPAPEYFTYRFTPDGISVRLAGGTYQILRCDLSAAIQNGIESLYQLADCNFDGTNDLLVPVSISENNVVYVLFCWDDSRAAFTDAAGVFSNPLIQADAKQIICLTQDSDTAAHVSVFRWKSNELAEIRCVSANYEQLQLTVSENGNEEITDYDAEDALTEALLAAYQ